MSFASNTQRTHTPLVRALADKSGQILTTGEIRQLVEELAPEIGGDIQWLHPTDHCDNHTVKDACACSKTGDAPLSRVSHGVFRVR
jgi:hypothetical protein